LFLIFISRAAQQTAIGDLLAVRMPPGGMPA
jgi:hypothetical protein